MNEHISIDGQIRQIDGNAAALSSATLFGKGVFTTIAIYDSVPFLWDKHWLRLTSNSTAIGIDLSQIDEEEVVHSLRQVIKLNRITTGRARITLSDSSPSPIWSAGKTRTTGISIISGDLRPIPPDFNLAVSSHNLLSSSPLAGIKSCNYLEKVIALDAAGTQGAHEAVRLNERGEIASACMANLFWLKNEELFTPSLSTGCLGGTTRRMIIESLCVEEVGRGIEALMEADEVFLTSAGLGVVQVANLGERKLARSFHPILRLLPDRI